MLTRQNRRLITLGAFAALTLGAGVAQAGHGDRYERRGHARHMSQFGYERAGTLSIDGARFTIRARGNVGREIARAFQRCGYSVRYEKGCLRVCGDRYRQPRVKWVSGSYRVSFRDDCGDLIVRWSKPRRASCVTVGGGSWSFSYNDRSYRDHKPRRRHWRSRRWCD